MVKRHTKPDADEQGWEVYEPYVRLTDVGSSVVRLSVRAVIHSSHFNSASNFFRRARVVMLAPNVARSVARDFGGGRGLVGPVTA